MAINYDTKQAIGSELWACGGFPDDPYGKYGTPRLNSLTKLSATKDWTSVSTGRYSSLALNTGGSLFGLGRNWAGQLGVGDTGVRNQAVLIGSDSDWANVSSGYRVSSAIKTDGSLWTWGANPYGQLGHGDDEFDKTIPTRVGGLNDWRRLSVGYMHIMALKTDGTLWTWGRNNVGQLGDGSTILKPRPIQVGVDADWKDISAGEDNSMAVKTDGTLWSWGDNTYGLLGFGNQVGSRIPAQVGTDTNWGVVSAGRRHAMAIKIDGTLWACGSNAYGALGTGEEPENLTLSFVQVGLASDWARVSSGANHTIALKEDGTFWSWGSNFYGQLGQGDFISRTSPTQIGVLTTWACISAGRTHTAALLV